MLNRFSYNFFYSLSHSFSCKKIGTVIFTCIILILAGCSAREKKDYELMPGIKSSIDVNAVWVAPTGERSEYAYRQLPISTRNNDIYLANAKGDVGVIDINTGAVKWVVTLDDRLSSGPGVGSGFILVASNDAEVIALDASQGKQLWRSKLSAIALAKPVVSNDKVFVQTIDEKLYALELDTGKRLWVDSRDVPALTLRGTTSPIVLNDRVVTGFANGRLAAFAIEDGKVIWETSISIPSGRTDLDRMVDIDGLFVSDDNLIYAASFQGNISAVSITDGTIVWNREMSSYQGINFADEQLFVTDAEGYVWAIDKKTGATLWRQDKLEGRDISTPVVMQQGIVVTDGAGYVHWLSKEDGDFVARQHLKAVHNEAFVDWGDVDKNDYNFGVTVIPIASDHKLLVRNDNGDLALFNVQKRPPSVKRASWYSPFTDIFN